MLKAASVGIDRDSPLEHAGEADGLRLLLGHDIENLDLIVKAYCHILCLELLHRIGSLGQSE